MKDIQVFKLNENAKLLTRNLSTDAGLDIYALEDTFLQVNETTVIKTGIAIRVPEGFVGKIEDRSGTSIKGLRTGGGVIDHGYNGEVGVVMHNLNNATNIKTTQHAPNYTSEDYGYWVHAGDKIAQLLLYKVEFPEVKETKILWDSERGDKGFNSSGR